MIDHVLKKIDKCAKDEISLTLTFEELRLLIGYQAELIEAKNELVRLVHKELLRG